jgi:phenylpropionate dioxygenase-like ring-hydroxylating dioxygenase large terminal subunit
MFGDFARVWTPLLPLRSLAQGPVGVQVAGERLAVFLGPGGTPGVLVDKCPHRGVSLSLGRITPEGCLECPFHGWRFGTDGANRGVPLNPKARLETLGATALPARAIGDFVWAYTDPAGGPPREPVVPETLTDPSLARIIVERTWNCHWTRAMENMLDSPHLPFVHRNTIGKFVSRHMKPDSEMEVIWEDTDFGGSTHALMDGRDGGGRLDFHRPNVMTLHIPIPRMRLKIHALVVPIDATHTRLFVVGARSFLKWKGFTGLFESNAAKIADEDRDVVESSWPKEVPLPSEEHSVGSDRATLAFRRYYLETLKGSSAG